MLTDAHCRNATCSADKKRARFTDSGGLYLEVSPGGSKRWFWKTYQDGKEGRMALGSYVSKLDQRVPVARTIRSIFNAPDTNEATRLLGLALEGWRKEHPKLAAWAEDNLVEGFTVFNLPPEHRARMRTTNGVERLNKEIKRRTQLATLFPNSASCLRLVSAILAEQDEEWMTAKVYLTIRP
jgi:putative transposase